MRRLLWGGAALVVCLLAARPAVMSAQGTACDSPCKVMLLPLIRQEDRPVPNSNPLAELQGKVNQRVAGNPVSATYFAYQVDTPATVRSGYVGPRYPDSLKTARVEGEVVASFVVDTTGLVDPASLHILRSTHPMFAAAAREAILRMRFAAAELHGVKVRQFVQQPFVFNLPH